MVLRVSIKGSGMALKDREGGELDIVGKGLREEKKLEVASKTLFDALKIRWNLHPIKIKAKRGVGFLEY